MDGQTGTLVPVHDVPRLAEAITNYVTDSDLARLVGATASKWVAEHFDSRIVTRAWLDLYWKAIRHAGLAAESNSLAGGLRVRKPWCPLRSG